MASTGTRKPVPTPGGGGSSGVATDTNQGGDDHIATGTIRPVTSTSFTGGLAQSMSYYTTSTAQTGGRHKGKVKGARE